MLDAYIIEQIKREEAERRDYERPRLYVELPVVWRPAQPETSDLGDAQPDFSVVIPLSPQFPVSSENAGEPAYEENAA